MFSVVISSFCNSNCSVLGTLVKNKLVPDPFYGLENESIIDIADSGREHYTFWFFTTFDCKPVCLTKIPDLFHLPWVPHLLIRVYASHVESFPH